MFFDEIGELAPLLQAKLLRVLQQREFERLGGTRSLTFTARVLAATNKNLEQAIKSGEFRQDLYYRLNVVSVTMPPLREHRDDIPLLALYFAAKYAAQSKRPFKGISREARALLMNYSWPGMSANWRTSAQVRSFVATEQPTQVLLIMARFYRRNWGLLLVILIS